MACDVYSWACGSESPRAISMGGLGARALILTTFFFPSVLYFVYTTCRSLAMSAVNEKKITTCSLLIW
jgi:hypothetical protein